MKILLLMLIVVLPIGLHAKPRYTCEAWSCSNKNFENRHLFVMEDKVKEFTTARTGCDPRIEVCN